MNKKVVKEEKIEELERAVKDWEERCKRALADYQNLERRTQEEKEKLVKSASEALIIKFLPVLDNLVKAAQHLNDEGLNLALRELREILAKEGLGKIEVLGRDFNPGEMEVVDTVKGEEENKVKKEFRCGYKLQGRVIRPAQVQVVKKAIEQKAQELAKTQLEKGEYM